MEHLVQFVLVLASNVPGLLGINALDLPVRLVTLLLEQNARFSVLERITEGRATTLVRVVMGTARPAQGRWPQIV